jgi:DNA helicase HerA-like ATPase
MNELDLGGIKLPLATATKAVAILAKRGAGKTYAAAVLAEEFHKNGILFVVFDPIDVWFGLRLSRDGKTPGLPVVVFGVENADVKLDKDIGKDIAQEEAAHEHEWMRLGEELRCGTCDAKPSEGDFGAKAFLEG